jgi:hypothetical protein
MLQTRKRRKSRIGAIPERRMSVRRLRLSGEKTKKFRRQNSARGRTSKHPYKQTAGFSTKVIKEAMIKYYYEIQHNKYVETNAYKAKTDKTEAENVMNNSMAAEKNVINDTRNQIETKEGELEKAKEEANSALAEYATARENAKNLKPQIEIAKQNKDKADTDYEKAKKELDNTVETANKKLDKAKTDLQQTKTQLAAHKHVKTQLAAEKHANDSTIIEVNKKVDSKIKSAENKVTIAEKNLETAKATFETATENLRNIKSSVLNDKRVSAQESYDILKNNFDVSRITADKEVENAKQKAINAKQQVETVKQALEELYKTVNSSKIDAAKAKQDFDSKAAIANKEFNFTKPTSPNEDFAKLEYIGWLFFIYGELMNSPDVYNNKAIVTTDKGAKVPYKTIINYVIMLIRTIESKHPHPELVNTILKLLDIVSVNTLYNMLGPYLDQVSEKFKTKSVNPNAITTYLEKSLARHESVGDRDHDLIEGNRLYNAYTYVPNNFNTYLHGTHVLNLLAGYPWKNPDLIISKHTTTPVLDEDNGDFRYLQSEEYDEPPNKPETGSGK